MPVPQLLVTNRSRPVWLSGMLARSFSLALASHTPEGTRPHRMALGCCRVALYTLEAQPAQSALLGVLRKE